MHVKQGARFLKALLVRRDRLIQNRAEMQTGLFWTTRQCTRAATAHAKNRRHFLMHHATSTDFGPHSPAPELLLFNLMTESPTIESPSKKGHCEPMADNQI